MKGTQIGLQLYTIRDLLKEPKDFPKVLSKVRKIGYRAVQTGLGQIETKELKKILDNEGLFAFATHMPIEDIINKTDAVIEDHKILGAKYVVCPYLPENFRSLTGYRKAARDLSRAGKVLAKNGFTLCYHNHGFEFERFGKKTGLEILYSASDPKYLKAELDTYWAAFGGGDPAAWCLNLKGRLPLVHLKDMVATKENTQVFAEIGEGNLNWKSILAACKKAGTRWYIVEQDVCRRDPMESIKISLNNLHKLGLK